EEREVDPGTDEHDERVEGDLAEQERPVVREDVAQRLATQRRRRRALVHEAEQRTVHDRAPCRRTPHQEGPTAPENTPPARRYPAGSTTSGSCGRFRPAAPKMIVPPVLGSKV